MSKTEDYLSTSYWNYFVDFVPIYERPLPPLGGSVSSNQ